jgi:regulator of sigma E protease
VAGPTTNFLMAVLLTAALFVHGSDQPTYVDNAVVVSGVLKDSPAQQAGIQAGDRIVSFAGSENPTWDRVGLELALATPGHEEPVVVERNGQTFSSSVRNTQNPFEDLGYPAEPAVVGKVNSGSPAEKGGLMPNDTIVAVDGEQLKSWYELSDLIQQGAGRAMQVQVLRDTKPVTLTLHPTWGDLGDGRPRWGIGINYRFATVKKSYSLPTATSKAFQFNLILARKLVSTVGDLFAGRASIKTLQGPLGIMQASGQAAQRGFGDLIGLMAQVSLSLAILNLLPIPILDGGHIFMLAVEGLLRHDLSLKLKERVVTAGMVFLLLIFLIVMYNDVLRLFPVR